MPRVHDLKIWPHFYNAIVSGEKTFEVRKDDRGYKVGDQIILRAYSPEVNCYIGAKVTVEITYRLSGEAFGIMKGYCVLGIKILK